MQLATLRILSHFAPITMRACLISLAYGRGNVEGVSLSIPLEIMKGSSGVVGSGVYFIDNKAKCAYMLATHRKNGMGNLLWEYPWMSCQTLRESSAQNIPSRGNSRFAWPIVSGNIGYYKKCPSLIFM